MGMGIGCIRYLKMQENVFAGLLSREDLAFTGFSEPRKPGGRKRRPAGDLHLFRSARHVERSPWLAHEAGDVVIYADQKNQRSPKVRIFVPIKQVPETNAVKMDEVTGTMIREGVEAIVNPLDLYAIEAAIQLRELYGGETVALSMGPQKAATALREAIAMGIDRAILLSHKAFAGSDTWATGYALSAAIRRMTTVREDSSGFGFD